MLRTNCDQYLAAQALGRSMDHKRWSQAITLQETDPLKSTRKAMENESIEKQATEDQTIEVNRISSLGGQSMKEHLRKIMRKGSGS